MRVIASCTYLAARPGAVRRHRHRPCRGPGLRGRRSPRGHVRGGQGGHLVPGRAARTGPARRRQARRRGRPSGSGRASAGPPRPVPGWPGPSRPRPGRSSRAGSGRSGAHRAGSDATGSAAAAPVRRPAGRPRRVRRRRDNKRRRFLSPQLKKLQSFCKSAVIQGRSEIHAHSRTAKCESSANGRMSSSRSPMPSFSSAPIAIAAQALTVSLR